MNISLAVGVSDDFDKEVLTLLESLGLLLFPLRGKPRPEDFACVCASIPSAHDAYIRGGGIVITFADATTSPNDTFEAVNTPFGIEDMGWLHDASSPDSILRFHYSPRGLGGVLVLPLSLISKWNENRLGYKIFFSGRSDDSPATEITTLIDKANIQRAMLLAFQHVFHRRGLPLLTKNLYPGGAKSVFCFRFDCDGGSSEDVITVVNRFRDDVPFQGYFLNISTYTTRTDLVRAIETSGGSVDSHSYVHAVFNNRELERQNILLAHTWIAKHASSPPRGFVCPGSGFNASTIPLLASLGYRHYASFGKDYDVLPYRLAGHGLWNLAFHPVSLGRLLRALGSYDEAVIFEYYQGVIKTKLSRAEPLFFYCHPEGRIARYPQVYEFIRRQALDSPGVSPISLNDYAEYLDTRALFQAEAQYNIETGVLSLPAPDTWSRAGIQPCLVSNTRTPLPLRHELHLPCEAWQSLSLEFDVGDTISRPTIQAVRQASNVIRHNSRDDWRLAARVLFPNAMRIMERHLKGRIQ